MNTQLVGLFPTPFMRVERLASAQLLATLLARIDPATLNPNVESSQLSHTTMIKPEEDALFLEVESLVTPKLVEFGAVLFGETLHWAIKEMWLNVLEHGGHQAVHSHANSFVSGILYLTPMHPSSHTVFHKSLSGTEFVFSNSNANSRIGPYNGNKWVLPKVAPGDLVLYPSYLLHEVPMNQGERRVTIALNAIPNRLDSWGYAIEFFR